MALNLGDCPKRLEGGAPEQGRLDAWRYRAVVLCHSHADCDDRDTANHPRGGCPARTWRYGYAIAKHAAILRGDLRWQESGADIRHLHDRIYARAFVPHHAADVFHGGRLDLFVGERERKTMEALLYAPTSDLELFLGKVLAAVIPAIALSWIVYLVYIIVVNAASYPLFGRIWFPLATWWPLMFWLTPALAVLGISATVLISSRVRTFMEAYQMSTSLVVIVLGLVIGQVSGVLFLGVGTALLIGLLIWLVDAALIYLSVKRFNRSSLIAKL